MKKNLVPFTDKETEFIHKVVSERQVVADRFPLSFALLTTFGFVSTLYGFEKLIDRVDLFNNNPWILLGVGVATLVITGVAYKKLG